jgi:hypothetical protein
MQTHGHVYVNGQKVLVLVRPTHCGVAIKLRKSGSDGSHFTDEEAFLTTRPDLAQDLQAGKVIQC